MRNCRATSRTGQDDGLTRISFTRSRANRQRSSASSCHQAQWLWCCTTHLTYPKNDEFVFKMMDVVYKNDNFRKAVEPRPEGSGTRHCALFRCGFIFKNEELCIKMMNSSYWAPDPGGKVQIHAYYAFPIMRPLWIPILVYFRPFLYRLTGNA